MSKFIVVHELIGHMSHVTDVSEGPINEDLSLIPELVIKVESARKSQPLHFATRREALYVATILEDRLFADVKKEHPEDWQDWLGDWGIWSIEEVQ